MTIRRMTDAASFWISIMIEAVGSWLADFPVRLHLKQTKYTSMHTYTSACLCEHNLKIFKQVYGIQCQWIIKK